MLKARKLELIEPKSFEAHDHWYPKALNATIHPMVNFFLNLGEDRIIKRYCHMHPMVDPEALSSILNSTPKYFLWAGADLINVTSAGGNRKMVVIETNSCPSGQKSMPLQDDNKEQGGYRLLMERTFKPMLKSRRTPASGGLAVLYDKNLMEVSGYAAVMADVMGEKIHLVPCYKDDPNPCYRFREGWLEILTDDGLWIPIRAAFRYVTQMPWTRIPLHTKTRILNPVLACLAGGRNKMIAAKAYDIYNAELAGTGLKIVVPETIWDVQKTEVPLWIRKMGGHAVVKVPYSNAGQGVFTIVNQEELDKFMETDFHYDRFIVQSLIGNYNWSSTGTAGKLYHVGTMPDQKSLSFVSDLRMMISATKEGIRPLCLYARKAKLPLVDNITDNTNSWDMLGTNLSVKLGENQWTSDTNRLMLTDRKDFNKLGLGLDDLLEAYIQTVLSMIAIDKMAQTLVNSKGKFRMKLFRSLNDDPSLINEILL